MTRRLALGPALALATLVACAPAAPTPPPAPDAVAISHAIAMAKTKGAKKAERHNNPFVDHWKKGADGTWRDAPSATCFPRP